MVWFDEHDGKRKRTWEREIKEQDVLPFDARHKLDKAWTLHRVCHFAAAPFGLIVG